MASIDLLDKNSTLILYSKFQFQHFPLKKIYIFQLVSQKVFIEH